MGLYTTLSHKYSNSFRITRDYSIIDLEYSLVVIVYNFNAIYMFFFKKDSSIHIYSWSICNYGYFLLLMKILFGLTLVYSLNT